MAKEGYILEDVNILTSEFTFIKAKPKNLIYKIDYLVGKNKDIWTILKYSGWSKIVSKGRWIFLCNENKVNINPSRENLLRRNKNIRIILGALGLYCCFYLGTMLVIMPSTFLIGLVGVVDTNESLTFPIYSNDRYK